MLDSAVTDEVRALASLPPAAALPNTVAVKVLELLQQAKDKVAVQEHEIALYTTEIAELDAKNNQTVSSNDAMMLELRHTQGVTSAAVEDTRQLLHAEAAGKEKASQEVLKLQRQVERLEQETKRVNIDLNKLK